MSTLSGLYGLAGALADGVLGGNFASTMINEIAPVNTPASPSTAAQVAHSVPATLPSGAPAPSWFGKNWPWVAGGGAAAVALVVAVVALKGRT